jgi:hypothetical protein
MGEATTSKYAERRGEARQLFTIMGAVGIETYDLLPS